MASVITIAGEQLFAAKAQANEQLDIDTFIFANVPNQNPNAPINREEGIPTAHIVYQQNVQQVGRINDNVVVYSTVLDSITGPFEFNWVGLYSSVNQKLVAINHVPTVTKTATAPGAAGNTLNRNFGIEYSGIAELTGITVDAGTWQLDFTARLSGMDLLTQQLAADMNGKDWFIDDGLKVVPRATANSFSVTPGVGYVSGLRVELKQEHILIVQSYPQFVYVDAWFSGNANSTWSPQLAFTVTNTEMDDYIDPSGTQHYVYKLSRINSPSDTADLRGYVPKNNLTYMREDFEGFTAALYADAGIDDNGQPDSEANSLRLKAITAISGARQFENVSAMLTFNKLVEGRVYCSGGTNWKYLGHKDGTVNDFLPLTEINVFDFGAKFAPNFDNASIFTAVAKKFDVKLVSGKTFESGQVVPSGNFNLNGKGGTIKLTSKTHPLFFDNSVNTPQGNFSLSNVKLDLSKDDIDDGNLAGTGVWLGNGIAVGGPLQWRSVYIENVDVVNGFRNCLNLLSVDKVFIRNYEFFNGGKSDSNFFSYGGSTENCRKVILEAVTVKDCYGFGWHLYRCDYVDACNVEFINLTRGGSAIGFTLTECKKVHIRNHVAQTDGDALEINASKDVIVENFDVNGGNRGLLIGDNGTGINNERITLRNGVVTGGGNYAAAINYCHKLLCEDVRFNGPISVITNEGTRSSDLRFKYCQIAQNISSSLVDSRFVHEQTRFLNCVYSQNENTFEMMDSGGVDLAENEYIVIPIKPILSAATIFYVEVYGELISAGAAQMGWRRYQCVYKGVNDANLNDLLIKLEDEERGHVAARHLTLEVVSGEMRATNKGTTVINGNFWLRGTRRTKSKTRPFP